MLIVLLIWSVTQIIGMVDAHRSRKKAVEKFEELAGNLAEVIENSTDTLMDGIEEVIEEKYTYHIIQTNDEVKLKFGDE